MSKCTCVDNLLLRVPPLQALHLTKILLFHIPTTILGLLDRATLNSAFVCPQSNKMGPYSMENRASGHLKYTQTELQNYISRTMKLFSSIKQSCPELEVEENLERSRLAFNK